MLHCIQLVEMVLTAVPTHLKLGSNLWHASRDVSSAYVSECTFSSRAAALLLQVQGCPIEQGCPAHTCGFNCSSFDTACQNAMSSVCGMLVPNARSAGSWLGQSDDSAAAPAHSICGTSLLCCLYAVKDPFQVSLKVHSPLIKTACGQGGQPAPHGCPDPSTAVLLLTPTVDCCGPASFLNRQTLLC